MDVLVLEDRAPVDATVFGLPKAARRRAGIVSQGVSNHAGDRRDPIADHTDMAKIESLELARWDLAREASAPSGNQ